MSEHSDVLEMACELLRKENKRLRDTIEVVLEDVVTLRVLGMTNLTSIRELLKKALEVDK